MQAPNDFHSFVLALKAAAIGVGAPKSLCDELGDMDSIAASAAFQAWQNVEAELHDMQPGEAWQDVASGYIHDGIMDIVDEWRNPMNYAPGTVTKQERELNSQELASKITDFLRKN